MLHKAVTAVPVGVKMLFPWALNPLHSHRTNLGDRVLAMAMFVSASSLYPKYLMPPNGLSAGRKLPRYYFEIAAGPDVIFNL